MPQKNLLETTYVCLGQPSSRMASPMMVSDWPPEYTSALSKKLTPPSYAAARQSRAVRPASWGPKLTHEPNDSTLSLRPEPPSRLYCMFIARGYASGEARQPERCAQWAMRPTPPAPI